MTNIDDTMRRLIILDISGIYAQIYNQGYFSNDSVEDIKKRYNDAKRWRVLVIN